nr:unnamed protein product [Digitaria exilis]
MQTDENPSTSGVFGRIDGHRGLIQGGAKVGRKGIGAYSARGRSTCPAGGSRGGRGPNPTAYIAFPRPAISPGGGQSLAAEAEALDRSRGAEVREGEEEPNRNRGWETGPAPLGFPRSSKN